jgi:hypothetical protein
MEADTTRGDAPMAKKTTKTAEKVDIRLRVDADFHERIQRVAEEEHTTVAGYLRACVVKDFKRREKGLD